MILWSNLLPICWHATDHDYLLVAMFAFRCLICCVKKQRFQNYINEARPYGEFDATRCQQQQWDYTSLDYMINDLCGRILFWKPITIGHIDILSWWTWRKKNTETRRSWISIIVTTGNAVKTGVYVLSLLYWPRSEISRDKSGLLAYDERKLATRHASAVVSRLHSLICVSHYECYECHFQSFYWRPKRCWLLLRVAGRTTFMFATLKSTVDWWKVYSLCKIYLSIKKYDKKAASVHVLYTKTVVRNNPCKKL